MTPTFFAKPAEFRKWLKASHKKETELIVGFYKVGSGKASITWPQSVDEALCFGWIDGVRTSIDEDSYKIRFTPRKAGSIWSAVNIKKMEALTKQGLMQPAGLAAFEKREEARSKIYSHEKEESGLDPAYEKQFKAKQKGLDLFSVTGSLLQKSIEALGNERKTGSHPAETITGTDQRQRSGNKPVEG